jgi:hypothetical protein
MSLRLDASREDGGRVCAGSAARWGAPREGWPQANAATVRRGDPRRSIGRWAYGISPDLYEYGNFLWPLHCGLC